MAAVGRVLRSALVGAVVVAAAMAPRARAQDISVQDVAAAEREEKAALAKVEAAHGNKPPQELSAEERAQIIREQQEASQEVYARHSLDTKAFAKRQMRMSPSERGQVEAEKARMAEEEKARLEREAAAAKAEPEELVITRGVDEKHPVDVYRAPGEPEVEYLSEGGEGQEGPAARPQTGHKAAAPSKPVKLKNPPRGKKSRRK